MTRANLYLVPNHYLDVSPQSISLTEKLNDHNAIIRGFLGTYKTRNYSKRTSEGDFRFIKNWFEGIIIPDKTHPDGERQLFVWEAMEPRHGRQRIIEYSEGLCALGLQPVTRCGYLGRLRRLFDYILEWPYIPVSLQSIPSKYGPLEQPVLTYDYPHHSVEQQDEGCALTGDALIEFYNFIRTEYVPRQQKKLAASRDYTMVIIAGESGLRADEILNLDAEYDLFFDRNFIQTRFGKGSKGSGKRTRKTIFTDLAQATASSYLKSIRPQFLNADTNPALFLAESGKRIAYSTMARNIKNIIKAAVEAGLDIRPDIGWHDLRRSFATNIIEQDPGRIWDVMEYLGHSNPCTLNRYLRFNKNRFFEVRNRVVQRLLPTRTNY